MSFGAPPAPSLPAIPAPPSLTDPEVERKKRLQRLALTSNLRGRKSTIFTSPLGIPQQGTNERQGV